MRRSKAVVAAVALLASALGLVGSAAPAAAYPYKDTVPPNGGPNDHGWFQAGLQWVGDFGDPTVVQVGSTYYAYSSPTGGRYLPVLTSTDLRTWIIHRNWSTSGPPGTPGYDVYADPAIPAEIRAAAMNPWDTYNLNDGLVSPPAWGLTDVTTGPWIKKDYWAPGVIQIGSTWYAYGAVRTSWQSDDPHGYGRFCLTVASAPSPLGPFRDISGAAPIQCQPVDTDPGGSIDPFPYRDPATGTFHLLWKAAGKIGVRESALMATELGSDGKPKAGAPVVKLLETNRADAWEGGTVENPGMITSGGTTYLFYSANDSASDANGFSTYATGYAVCPQGPTGPCNRIVHSPLLQSDGFKQGPGGSSPFVGPDGRLRVAYASYEWLEPARDNGLHPRRLHIAVLERSGDGTLRYLGDEEDVPAPTAPGAPPAPVAAPGDGWATVSWSPPSSDGGNPVTGYTVTSSPGGKTCTWSAGPRWCTVSGLTNGTGYSFTVTAQNAIGTGPASPASSPVVPSVPVDDLFHPLDPSRIVDSRPGPTQIGPYSTPWTPGLTRDIEVTGVGGVPVGADAVVLNVTVTDTSSSSFMTVWPAGQPRPSASNLNWTPGQTIPNAVTVKVGAGGSASVFSALGNVHVIVDVVGYYDDAGPGAGFTPLSPSRILDPRPAFKVGPYSTPWGSGETRPVPVADVGGVPANADAVVLNVTVTDTSAASFLTVWPHGPGSMPTASSLNWSPGQTIANAVTVKVGDGGAVDVYSRNGTVNVVIDVVGYFDVGSGAAFHPLTPARVQDSRQPVPVGAYGSPWGPGTSRTVAVGGAGGVPTGAQAVLANATVTDTSASSFLTVWPAGQARPNASSLNWVPGQTIPNSVTARLGTGGELGVYSKLGTVNVILDVAGWYG